MRACAPVVRIGEEHSAYCVFGLHLGEGEYFIFRDVFAHIDHAEPKDVTHVPERIGIRGLFRCILEKKVSGKRKPKDFPVRHPRFSPWWDGTDEELFMLMLLLVKSDHDVEVTLNSAAQAIKTPEIADRIIADNRFPASTRFAALHATETNASIELLCAYVNAHGGSAHELHVRLQHVDPLIQLLTRRGELERIRPAIEKVPTVFEWWNAYHNTSLLEAVRILTGVTR